MARRAKRKSRRRGSSTPNIRTALTSLISLEIIFRNVTGNGMWNFFTAGTAMNPNIGAWGTPASVGGHQEIITLKELLAGVQTSSSAAPSPFTQMGSNLQKNFIAMTFSLIGLKISTRVLGKLGAYRNFNRLVAGVGMKGLVKA